MTTTGERYFSENELYLAGLFVPERSRKVPGRTEAYYNDVFMERRCHWARATFLRNCRLGKRKLKRWSDFASLSFRRAFAVQFPLADIRNGAIVAFVDDQNAVLIDRVRGKAVGRCLVDGKWDLQCFVEGKVLDA